MAKKTILKAKNVIKDIFKKKNINIYQIIFFGSQVTGNTDKDSDIDVIIVSKLFRGKGIFEKAEMVCGLHRELVKSIRQPVDLLYYSDQEWEKGSSLIIQKAKQEGMAFSF